MSDFSLIPIEKIQWTDVCSLLGEPETPTLEFKRDLRVPKGGQHPWHLGQDLDRHARDSIASEVVGFANAWGGTLVLGADEDKSTPRRCSEILPLPRAALLASKLEASLASIIDPPLANLVCRAVLDPTSQDSGVVLISVSRSVLAPHGYGEPPAAYVRRGSVTAPMTMQDLQNLFWDARMRADRIEVDRDKASRYLLDCVDSRQLHREARQQAPNPPQGVFYRFGCYPQASLQIPDMDARRFWLKSLRPEGRYLFEHGPRYAAGDGLINWSPRPIAHGVQIIDQGPSKWIIRDSGAMEVFGYSQSRSLSSESQRQVINPSWIIAPAAQLIVMAEVLRRLMGKPGVPYEIDAEVIGVAVEAHSKLDDWESEIAEVPQTPTRIGPFIYGKEALATSVFEAIERELWHALGLAHIKPISTTPKRAVDALLMLINASH